MERADKDRAVNESAVTDGVPEEFRHAVGVFFEDETRAETLARFVGHLASSAVERGLIGPREVPRLWERHVLNCAAVAPLLGTGTTLMDVGSGAGLPGIVLAIARPDVTVTLVEPLQRRANWLAEVTTDLGLGNVVVHRGRAEEVRGLPLVDVVTARAVAALDVLAGWCLPHVRPGGELLALKGQSAAEELVAAEARLRRLGATSWSVVRCGEGVLVEPTTVVRVVAGGAASKRAGKRAAQRVKGPRGSAEVSRRTSGGAASGTRSARRRTGEPRAE